MSTTEDVVTVEEAGGGVPPLKWDQGLFDQVFRGHQFVEEWDAWQLLITSHLLLGDILQYYGFHISQLSPMGMVHIRNFEFVCRSQGEQPNVDRFRAFYQLQSNLGFFSFSLRATKKILINLPKSFHDWKIKFFYIRSKVIRMVMKFHDMASILKEDLKIPRGTTRYEKLLALRNQAGWVQLLVAAGMSDRWPHDSTNLPVHLLEEVALYHRAFPAHADVIGVRPLRAGEEYWSK
ncbi:hypothetical protein Hanom_Chr01g00061811 [Helianthus anomalus]